VHAQFLGWIILRKFAMHSSQGALVSCH
jgi:hypothetical protein